MIGFMLANEIRELPTCEISQQHLWRAYGAGGGGVELRGADDYMSAALPRGCAIAGLTRLLSKLMSLQA